jgi:hypothetical protein
MKSRTLRIRHALFLGAFLFGIFGVSWGQIWLNHLTYGRPFNLTRYVGDQFNLGSTYYYQFEIGQASWNESSVGIGKNTDGTTGWNWYTASWYQDGSGSNKKVQADIGTYQFTSSGNFYVVGRARAQSIDPYTYSEESGWNNNTTLSLSTTSGNASYINVSDLQPPTAISVQATPTSFSQGAITLNWTKFASKNVIVVYNTTGNFTAPTNGTSYNTNSVIGSGTVVYNGSATTTTINGLNNGVTYYFVLYTENNGYYSSGISTSKIIASTLSSGNWSNASIWGGGIVPTSNQSLFIGHDVAQDQNAEINELTIYSGSVLTVNSNSQLTINGTLTNNGTLTLKDGATLVQSTGVTSITGGGTFTVEKALSGNSSSWTSSSGRFWYMGVPMVNVARSSFGSYDAGTNRVWSYAEATKLYTDITDNATTLSAGTGYVHRRSADGTLTFSASGLDGLYRSDVSLTGLSRTAGASAGYHLISNPYMAYIDWDAVIAANGTSNIESTYYIRSAEPSNNNALISYNSNGPNYASGGVSSIDQVEDVRYIAPMQSIWVRVGTASATGSLAMSRSMLSHQSSNPGLKNTSIFPTSARVNLVDGGRFDQILVFMNQDMSNGVDQFDSEKMFVNGAPQIYTMAAGKKLVMNGLKNNKKKISVPLYLELPESKVYNLQLTEYILEDGLILLEDKQEGTIQDFSINAIYPFYANSGLLQNRFVLHFIAPDNGIGAQGPNNNWVAEETSYVEGGDILISSDSKGKVQVTLDQPLAENVTGMVQATDVNGKIVFSGQLEGILTEFQMNVPSGIYYLSVQNGSIIQNKKVFVQN